MEIAPGPVHMAQQPLLLSPSSATVKIAFGCWNICPGMLRFHLQTLHDERFLLVVKSTPAQHGETAAPGIAAVPVVAETTLLLVSLC